jgi:hypothetical protein
MTTGIKFAAAIELTQQFVLQLQAQALTAEQIEKFVADLVQTQEGARGFFVGYLTSNEAIADQLNLDIIKGLATHPEVVADLLVKNLAMSTAQNLHFLRASQADMAANSATVAARSAQLITALQLPICKEITLQIVEAIRTGTGAYADFLVRWGYDTEQKQAIETALLQIHNPRSM